MSTKNLRLIFRLSLLASIGSLYFGYFGDIVANIQTGDLWNINNAIVPCNMCRYIRVFMYPIPFIALIAILLKDKNAKYYIILFSIIGLLLCAYKYGLEMRWISDSSLCLPGGVNCAVARPNYFGFLSMALLGGIANLIMIILSLAKNKTIIAQENNA